MVTKWCQREGKPKEIFQKTNRMESESVYYELKQYSQEKEGGI